MKKQRKKKQTIHFPFVLVFKWSSKKKRTVFVWLKSVVFSIRRQTAKLFRSAFLQSHQIEVSKRTKDGHMDERWQNVHHHRWNANVYPTRAHRNISILWVLYLCVPVSNSSLLSLFSLCIKLNFDAIFGILMALLFLFKRIRFFKKKNQRWMQVASQYSWTIEHENQKLNKDYRE